MNKTIKWILIGAGAGLGVLVIGAGVAYAVMTDTPDLEREVGVLEELLPKGPVSYVVGADLNAAEKLYRNSKIGHLARKHEIDKDFSSLEKVSKVQEQTKGRFWDVLGARFIYARYGEENYLIITQPGWKVKAMWRTIITSGEKKEAGEIPYTVFTGGTAAFFAGDYFWYASSEKLLLSALKIAMSEDVEERAFPRDHDDEPLAYGISRKPGKYLVFDEARWLIQEGAKGLEVKVEIDSPSGVIGGFIANAKPPEDYSKIPADAALFINLTGVDPYRAWKEAGMLSSEEGITEVLGDFEVEKEFARIAVDLEDEAMFIMQGWDVDRWYAPARWLISVKAGSERSFESWVALTPWFFPAAWDTTLTHGEVAYTMLDLGEDLPPISYLFNNSYLTVTSDSALVPWILDAYSAGLTLKGSEDFAVLRVAAGISEPVACVNWPMFRKALKEYLIYAADRTAGFTPANVEQKLFPILDAFEMNALLIGMEHEGNALTFTIRSAN
ncbi:hypothetical protein CEE36_03295 [candidate division TA06 bacterium B3_TA06]|uniref:Uncharacterized protein n=1 Tax=candidate division TA06 bacterium B3_TA06 TaxID=2012487 RepID=A0A532V953_UNCT6|nr:MAG: hypothetical protein CEE36_03295 [candidate division TA06 bacterium B3_TA06]